MCIFVYLSNSTTHCSTDTVDINVLVTFIFSKCQINDSVDFLTIHKQYLTKDLLLRIKLSKIRIKFSRFEFMMDLDNTIYKVLPSCVKKILFASGYDNVITIASITKESIVDLEKYIETYGRATIQSLNCRHAYLYQQQQPKFVFLPAHRFILRNLPNFVSKQIDDSVKSDEKFSVILKALVETARVNATKDKNHHVYDDKIRFFFTYIYLLCGRQCYETLSRNLPIPSTMTIRKLFLAL